MRLSVFALMLVVFAFTTGEFVIVGILPEVAAGLAVSVPAAGLLVTAYAIGMIVGGPVVTIMTARLGRKPLIGLLVAVAVLGNLGSAMAPTYPLLLAARFVSGLVVATFFAVGIATAVSLAPPGAVASTVARVTLGLNLGIVLGAPLGTVVGQHVGWRATFVTVALLALLALVLVLRSVPPQPPMSTGSPLSELRVLARREVRAALALTAVGNVGVVMVFTYIAPLLVAISGFEVATVPTLLLVYGSGAVLGNALGGRLADRSLLPSLTVLLTALAGTLVAFWLLSPLPAAAVVLVFLTGLLAFAVIPGMQTRVLATAAAAPTLALAVNASGFQLAAAVAGWAGGRVLDSTLGLRSIYLVGACLTVLGVLVALTELLRDRRSTASAAGRGRR